MKQKQNDAMMPIDGGQGDLSSSNERKLSRRKFLISSSVIAGAAVVGAAAVGTSLTASHAAGAQKAAAKSTAVNHGLPVFRFVHAGGHFYTIDPAEAAAAGPKFGYTYEGVAFDAFSPYQAPAGTVSVFRLVKGSDHLYTIDPNEAALAHSQLGYTLEGPAFNVYKTSRKGTIAIYRLHSPTQGHFYTTLPEARNAVKHFGYTFEPAVRPHQNPIPYFYALPPSVGAKF